MFLNENGGIEADLTVTRLSETAYLAVVPGATLAAQPGLAAGPCRRRFRRHHRCDGGESVLCLMGPQSRDLMARCRPTTSATPRIPLARRGNRDRHGPGPRPSRDLCRRTGLGALRQRRPDRPCVRGAGRGRRRSGAEALRAAHAGPAGSRRPIRHWGHDITDEDHVLEAGLGFTVSRKKPPSSAARRCCARKRPGWTARCCSSA
jgi:hypothetical protein